MADFNDKLGDKVLNELAESYSKDNLMFVKTNVTSYDSILNLKEKTFEKFGHVNSIINNAGIFVKGALHEVSESDWDKIISVDLKSIFLTTKVFVPEMIKQRSGTIINTASVSGMMGDFNMASYSAAKGAIINLVKSMALDYGQYNIRVNNVAPGPTNTPMFQANPPKVIDSFIKSSPLNKIVEPEDIAQMMYFLSSDNSSSITGQTIPVTAGFGIYSNQPKQ